MGEKCLEKLISSILRDDIAPEEIGLIINTHSHPDHCEANQAMAQMNSGSGTDRDQALIAINRSEDQYRRAVGLSRMMGISMEFEPDFYLQEGELNIGRGDEKLNLQIVHAPGHSPGSICIYSPHSKVLISGDVVFNGSIGRTDLPGGDSRMLKQSIEKLSNLDVEYLLPGHSTNYGDIIRGKNNVVQNFAFIRMNYFPFF
jgi:glyoxylase-like metal-dependent hydrolase (beta-lactamase superfamily II)